MNLNHALSLDELLVAHAKILSIKSKQLVLANRLSAVIKVSAVIKDCRIAAKLRRERRAS